MTMLAQLLLALMFVHLIFTTPFGFVW